MTTCIRKTTSPVACIPLAMVILLRRARSRWVPVPAAPPTVTWVDLAYPT